MIIAVVGNVVVVGVVVVSVVVDAATDAAYDVVVADSAASAYIKILPLNRSLKSLYFHPF